MARSVLCVVVLVLFVASAAIAAATIDDNQLVSDYLPQLQKDLQANSGESRATWTAGANKFSGMTWGQVKKMLLKTYPERTRLPEVFVANMQKPATTVPEAFDQRTAWPNCVKPIRDQGHCGSCWAVSAAETLTDLFCVGSKGAFNKTLSPQDLVSCDKLNMGCNGGILPLAWSYLEHSGIVDESCFPYVSGSGNKPACPSQCNDGGAFKSRKHHAKTYHHLGSIFQPSERPDKIAEYVMNHGAAQTGFSVYQDFIQYKGGVYQHLSGGFLGGHAVKIIGWGVDKTSTPPTPYWIVANSWGTKWGEQGYFRIRKGNDECGFERDAYSGEPRL